MAHGFVLGGIGLHLGAIEGHMTQAHHAGLLAEPQNLHNQPTERLEVAAAELTDPAVIWLLVAGEHPERQILVTGPLDPVGGDDAGTVGVKQSQRHLPGVKPLLPARIFVLGRDHVRRQIQLVDRIEQEIHLMVSRQPVTW